MGTTKTDRGIALETRGEIRRTLEGDEIRAVNFPEWVGTTEGEARAIEIKLISGRVITIAATSYQTLKIDERWRGHLRTG